MNVHEPERGIDGGEQIAVVIDHQGLWGGKILSALEVARVEEVEWRTLPDPSTAVSALQTGEVDVLEAVPPDLAALLRTKRDVVVEVINPYKHFQNDRVYAKIYPLK